MSLRNRIGLAGGLVVFGALTIAALIIYPVVGSRLYEQLDASLAKTVTDAPNILDQSKRKAAEQGTTRAGVTGLISVGSTTLQFIPRPVHPGPTDSFTPLTKRDSAVATLHEQPYFQNVTFHGVGYRLYTAPVPQTDGSLVRIARPRSDATATLSRLRILLVLLTLGGALLAAAVARLSAGRVLRPVQRLTDTIEHVTATQQLTARIPAPGNDEIGRLARSFNAMMTELEASLTAQQRLVADASHELRTPLTSLTTDLDLLSDGRRLADPAAPELVQTARQQARRLTTLVNDLLELARHTDRHPHTEDVRLDLLALQATQRAARHTPTLHFQTNLTETMVHADPDAIERAISNLLDNAAKFSPPHGEVHVHVANGTVTVTDEGPGIPESEIPHVFDRFYRSATARSHPGSGLGLAIVRQIAHSHGGTAAVIRTPQGAKLTLTLPGGGVSHLVCKE
jgi:two-component system sensor histidine kinase MprB